MLRNLAVLLGFTLLLAACHPEAQQRSLEVKLTNGGLVNCEGGYSVRDSVIFYCYQTKTGESHQEITIPWSTVREIRFVER